MVLSRRGCGRVGGRVDDRQRDIFGTVPRNRVLLLKVIVIVGGLSSLLTWGWTPEIVSPRDRRADRRSWWDVVRT